MTPDQEKGQDGSCATIKIKSGDSYAVINAHDFDEKVHEKFVEPKAKKDEVKEEKKK